MTKGGEVLKNNYTVSSRKRFLFYILMILSLLCIIALQFFLDRMKGMEIQQKKSYLPGNFYLVNKMEAVKRSAFRDSMM